MDFIILYKQEGKAYPQSVLLKVINATETAWSEVVVLFHNSFPNCKIVQITVWG
jgi:hypothetical protein